MLNNQKENKEFLGKEEMGVDLAKEAPIDEISAASATVQKAEFSGLKHVETSVVNRIGRCLQACIAMWVNRSNGTNLTADKVYDDMVAFGNQQSPTIAVENVPADRMLQEYYHCGPCNKFINVAPSNVLTQLQAGKPVIMYIKNSSNDLKHAVIVKGIEINKESVTYTIDDPNCGTGTIKQTTPSDTPSEAIKTYTSTYNGTKFTYDTWYATIAVNIW